MIIKFSKKIFFFLVFLGIFVSSAFAANQNWEQLYSNTEAIIPKVTFENIDSEKGLERLRISKFDLGRSYRNNKRPPNILIKDNYLYMLDSNNTIVLFSLENRRVVKRFRLREYRRDVASGMAIADDNLYLTFESGVLISFSLTTKEINWVVNVGIPINSAPVVNNNEVFFVANNTIYAVSTTSGNVLWNHIGSKAGVSLRMLFAPSVYSGYLFLGLSSSDVLVLRQEQGNLFFRTNISNTGAVSFRLNPLMGDIKSPIIPFNDNIIAGSNNRIVMFNLASKQEIWRNTQIGTYSTPIVSGNSLLLISTTGSLVSLNPKNGVANWSSTLVSRVRTKRRIFWYGPIAFNDKLFIANSVGEIMLVDKTNGNLLSYRRLFTLQKERVFSPPVVTDEYIAIFSSYGNLYINRR
ncbi:MAG: PQQ-binding-like beta-propeller repeat protein [Alphaproteobacteria bacterium]|jgi:outer membrane protein assembly factor BamB|nr:PQQ-binding-like beta-propeller repeat protein [Alphaproteobacteria bacterium]